MKYFVTLVFGDSYSTLRQKFEYGVEQAVDEATYNYLAEVTEGVVKDEGNRQVLRQYHRFDVRTEELNKTETILAEVEGADPSLAPRKPGRPAKAD